MPIWLLKKTFEADRAQGEPFRLDPSLIRGPLDGPIDTSEWHLGKGIPPFFNHIDSAYFQSGWQESGVGYSADKPQHTLSTDYYYTTFGFRFVNFSEPVEFSFDVFAKSEWYEQLRHPITNDNRPIGNYFIFKVHDCDDGSYMGPYGLETPSALIHSEIVAGYQQKTINYTIPAGPHCLVFEYKRTWLEQYQWFDETGWRITTVVDPASWIPVQSGQTADNTVTLSNFTPIMDSSIAVYCPASGEEEDTPAISEINISGYAPEDFAGLWDEWDGEAINISAFPDASEIGSDVVEDIPVISINEFTAGDSWSIPATIPDTSSPVGEIPFEPMAVEIYDCILSCDGFDDLVLSISSFTARINNSEPTYLGCTIPNILDYETAINERSEGEISVRKGFLIYGVKYMEPIATVDFDYLDVDEGSSSASGNLVGYRTRTYEGGIERELKGISYRSTTTEGLLRLRCEVDMFVNPGDVVYFRGQEIIIGSITVYVGETAYMEILEGVLPPTVQEQAVINGWYFVNMIPPE